MFVAFAALLDGGDDDNNNNNNSRSSNSTRHEDGEAEAEGGGAAPVFLRRWGAHVNHFLGYFPYPQAKPVILPLVELRRSLAPCFAALPAGDMGRAREGVPTRDDDAPSPKSDPAGALGGFGGGGRGGGDPSVS